MKFSFTLTPLREWAGSRCCEEMEMEGTGVAWGPLWISVLISRLRQRAPESEFRNCILKPSPGPGPGPDQAGPGRQWARRVAPNGKSCPLPAITVKCALTQSFLKCKWGKRRQRERGEEERERERLSLSLILHAAVFGFICLVSASVSAVSAAPAPVPSHSLLPQLLLLIILESFSFRTIVCGQEVQLMCII